MINHEDWIELYNAGNSAVDLGGWYFIRIKKPKPMATVPQGWTHRSRATYSFGLLAEILLPIQPLHTNFEFTQTNGVSVVVIANAVGTMWRTSVEATALGHSPQQRLGQGAGLVHLHPAHRSLWKLGSMVQSLTLPDPGYRPRLAFTKVALRQRVTATAGVSCVIPLMEGNVGGRPAHRSIMLDVTSVLKVRHFSNDTLVLPGLMDFATFFINEPETDLPVVGVAWWCRHPSRRRSRSQSNLILLSTLMARERKATSFRRTGQPMARILRDQPTAQPRLDPARWDGLQQRHQRKIFQYSDRDEYQRIILRASGDDNYPSVGDQDHGAHIRDE